MKKTVLTFGVISGLIAATLMAATVPFAHHISFAAGLVLGYTTMVASFLLVFFGIRSYRDNFAGGGISFGRAFAVGILITLITCAFYVGTWEIIYFNFMPNFMTDYNAAILAKAKAAGASAAALQAKAQELQRSKELYDKPLYNAVLTFMEPFPVGLLLTLLSAAVLRRKSPDAQPATISPSQA